jgi:N-glycosylase/DNA lyase
MPPTKSKKLFHTKNYDLAATLNSGQVFRWLPHSDGWIGVVGKNWVRLRAERAGIAAETAEPVRDWQWLATYLQTDVDLDSILATFPDDAPMRAAVAACRGLRLLRQDLWECLASFILSSTKQVVQIRQIIALLCERHGEPLPTPRGHAPAFAFPSPEQLAEVSEGELRCCKAGFRAPNLHATALAVARGKFDLDRIRDLPLAAARDKLMKLPGVGPKVANCVLLFAYGFQTAFPIDVWVLKALRQLYFPHRRPSLARLRQFARMHFGPHAGYAQQYLFHYMRTHRNPRSRRHNEAGNRPEMESVASQRQPQ